MQQSRHLRDLALPRQEHQQVARMRRQRLLDRALCLVFDGFLASRREMRDLDRMAAPGAAQSRRVEEAGEPFAIQRRRHRHDPQVLAQPGLHIQRQCQAEIAGQVAFVEFVEQQGTDAFQQRIVLQHAGEDAFGDHDDPGLRRDLVLEADAVADGLAHRLTELFRHEAGGGARGDPARLQHHDLLAAQPVGLQQRQRHPGGLARAGRCFQHEARMRRQRSADLRQQVVDRKMHMRIVEAR